MICDLIAYLLQSLDWRLLNEDTKPHATSSARRSRKSSPPRFPLSHQAPGSPSSRQLGRERSSHSQPSQDFSFDYKTVIKRPIVVHREIPACEGVSPSILCLHNLYHPCSACVAGDSACQRTRPQSTDRGQNGTQVAQEDAQIDAIKRHVSTVDCAQGTVFNSQELGHLFFRPLELRLRRAVQPGKSLRKS
jgi:hypothetical protein